MPPLAVLPLPLVSGAPADGYGGPKRDMLSVSGTTAFETGIDQRDRFLGQRRCIICRRNHPALLQQNCHIISPLEEDTVSRVSYTTPFSKIKIKGSGEILSDAVGYLRRPNDIRQNMNRIMA
jgi:hypothetical protein